MGFDVSKELHPQKIGELQEGDVFIAHPDSQGRLVGMIGGNETERLLIILGSEQTTLDKLQVGWFRSDTLSDEIAYKIQGARIEVIRNKRGYAEGGDSARNGCVILDSEDRGWIYTVDEKSRVSFNLETGLSGKPAAPIRRYADWRIVWTPEGSKDPLVLWEHRRSAEAAG